MLRQLGIEVTPSGDDAVDLILATDGVARRPDGRVDPAAIATAVDVAGGLLTARAVHPDWIATSSLSVDLRRPADVGGGSARVRATVLRAGRSAVVVGHRVFDDRGEVGVGTLTFSRLERREGNPDVQVDGPRSGSVRFVSDPTTPGGLDELVGCEAAGDGSASLALTDRVRNSLGAVQGGMVALVAERAAEAVASANGWRQPTCVDLALDYVGVARSGPIRAVAAVVRRGADHLRLRVEVTDEGAGRLAAVAAVSVIDLG